MKGFAFVLLCALVAVQARNTGVQSTRSAAALGDNPWLVHLRIATGTSGLLSTCVGTLINQRWVLTAASCVSNARFIWIRYGVVNVIKPELVTETSTVRADPTNNIGLISINRVVEYTANISPISPSGEAGPSGRVCSFGEDDSGAPGENLNCYDVDVAKNEDNLEVSGNDVNLSRFDLGAALVSEGAQVGLLVDESGTFLATAGYAEWIESVAGVSVSEVAPEAVHFV